MYTNNGIDLKTLQLCRELRCSARIFSSSLQARRLRSSGFCDCFKHYLNWRIWKYICVPAVAIVFLCLLLNSFHRERVRVAELSQALAEAAALDDAPTRVLVRNLEDFKATAYCVTGITKSGVPVATGHVAADSRVIPLGSMIYVDSALMGGIYQVTDTGRLIKGKIIDIFIPNYNKSIEFGRRNIKLKVLRYGYGDDNSLAQYHGSSLSIIHDHELLRISTGTVQDN
jgi:3D (Asp-Asp-Asp) domain-containing protein